MQKPRKATKANRPRVVRRKRDAFRSLLKRVVGESDLAVLEKLSEDTGIALAQVHQDAVKEGAAVLRVDGYESLITFRKRVGKVVHERQLGAEESGELADASGVSQRRELEQSPGIALADPQGVSSDSPTGENGSHLDELRSGHSPETRPADEPHFGSAGLETPAPGAVPEGIDDLPI